MKGGETEEDVDINVEILSNILKNVLDNSCKRKLDGVIDCYYCKAYVLASSRGCDAGDVEGDRYTKLEEYYNWGLT